MRLSRKEMTEEELKKTETVLSVTKPYIEKKWEEAI